MNSKCKATQIPIECYNTTVVLLHTGNEHLLLIAYYELRSRATVVEKEEALRARIENIIRVREKAD